MPTDNKRLAVPEKTIPYQFYAPPKRIQPLVDESGKRRDTRKAEDIRPMFIKTKIVTQAKGSAYIEIGHTKVSCSVFGPREVAKREEFSMTGALQVDFKFATFGEICRRGHQQDGQEKDLSLLLQETLQPAVLLHKFPKCQVDISITVLENGGSCLSAAITAASIALVDAGIEMYDVVIGSSVMVCPLPRREDEPERMVALVDPSLGEETTPSCSPSPHALLIVGFMPALNQIAGFHQTGGADLDAFHAGIRASIEASTKILPLVRKKIAESNRL